MTYKLIHGDCLEVLPTMDAARQSDLYRVDDESISTAVRNWAIENGGNQKMRIALCGYEHEHATHMPESWDCVAWNAGKGYAAQNKQKENDNGKQERIWFSPHCVSQNRMTQGSIFG